MPKGKTSDHRPPPVVVYAPLGELKVYEISEAELEKLENGPPGQIHLSFALALLPAAMTILITLQTVTISDDRYYNGYLFAFWVFLVQGIISLVQWFFKNRSFRRLTKEIRARMPAKPGIPEQILEPMAPHERDAIEGPDPKDQ
jgi:hypothetical protein